MCWLLWALQADIWTGAQHHCNVLVSQLFSHSMAVFLINVYKHTDTGLHLTTQRIFYQTAYNFNHLVPSLCLAVLSPVPLTIILLQLQEALQVKPNTKFEGCSSKVAAALGPNFMKSVKYLIPDLLSALPVLLYQGLSDSCMNTCCMLQ